MHLSDSNKKNNKNKFLTEHVFSSIRFYMNKQAILIAALLFLPASFHCASATSNGKRTVRTEARFAPQVKKTGHVYRQTIDSRARTFYIDGIAYYCNDGVYYRHVQGKGYEEIQMPENVVVQDLPYGARRTYVNGYSYYNADGMWFQPITNGFLIVGQPRTANAAYNPTPAKTYKATFGY